MNKKQHKVLLCGRSVFEGSRGTFQGNEAHLGIDPNAQPKF